MKTLKKIAVIPLLLSASFAVNAGNLSYNYAEVGTTHYPDLFDGLEANVSIELADRWYVRLSGQRESDNLVEKTAFNIGYKTSLNEVVDFVAEIGYEDYQITSAIDDAGYNALVGLRTMASERLEFGLFTAYSDVLESTDIIIESRYHFSDSLSLALEVGNDSVITEHYGFNLRYSF